MKRAARIFSGVFAALIAAVAILSLVAGCANLEGRPGAQALAKTAIQVAALKIAEDGERAERVIRVVDSAIAIAEGDLEVTLASLEAAIRAEIDWPSLDPEDALLVNALIYVVRAELKSVFTESEMIAPENRVRLLTVLGWVREAAALRLQPMALADVPLFARASR
ncbi:MAG: hypothetical protein AB7P52_17720 [Alphaproteobacteria bacterium]